MTKCFYRVPLLPQSAHRRTTGLRSLVESSTMNCFFLSLEAAFPFLAIISQKARTEKASSVGVTRSSATAYVSAS